MFRASFFCSNFAFFSMSNVLWKSPDCEKLKSTCDNLGAVYSWDVDGKQVDEKILDCKMLVSIRTTLKISAFWSPPDILRIALQIMLMMAVCIASSERSFSKLKLVLSYLRASMTNNKSGQVVWSSFDENRKGRNRESWLWWNHRRLCFDKGTERGVFN